LGVACWPGNDTLWSFYGMLTYSTLAMLYLSYIGVHGEFAGALLWPAAAVHAILIALLGGAWLIQRKSPATVSACSVVLGTTYDETDQTVGVAPNE
jgi:hypothetical protein